MYTMRGTHASIIPSVNTFVELKKQYLSITNEHGEYFVDQDTGKLLGLMNINSWKAMEKASMVKPAKVAEEIDFIKRMIGC